MRKRRGTDERCATLLRDLVAVYDLGYTKTMDTQFTSISLAGFTDLELNLLTDYDPISPQTQ